MPDVALAPNAGLLAVVAAQPAPTPESTAPAKGAEGADSFSSVLGRQMNSPPKSEKSAAKDSDVKAPETPASSAQANDSQSVAEGGEISTDVIALLAGMLGGIAPPPQVAQAMKPVATQEAASYTAAANQVDVSTVPIAAPTIAAAPTQATNDTTRQKTEAAPTLPTATRKEEGAAILAAPTAATETDGAETAHRGAAKHENFDALLAAARETAATNGNANMTAANKSESPQAASQVTTPVGAAGWANEVGEKLTWMVGSINSKAELVLTPPHMGRIEVSITVSGDQATATFVAASPAVREALENAVPRLREILQDAGINLGQAHVGAESSQQSANRGESGDNRSQGATTGRDDGDAGPSAIASGGATRWLRQGNGLVDTFA